MNVFLTGDVQVGKSTIIQKYLKSFNGIVCGFLTKKLPHEGEDKIYIFDINDPDKSPKQNNFIALCGCNKIVYKYDKPFETIGAKSIQDRKCDLIVMDELGILERDAKLFQNLVFKALDSKTTVIGVIKPKHNEFLDTIRRRDDVLILDITQENRNTMVLKFENILKENMGV